MKINEPNVDKSMMSIKQNYLKERTKSFALQIIKLVEALPRGRTANVLGRQLLGAGTSVGANYRAACRAKSPADFISKMGIVEEEADETIYWMELLIESGLVQKLDILNLLNEVNQILAMTVSSIKTAKRKNNDDSYSAIRTPHSALKGHSLLTKPFSIAKVVKA
jgi:four helix bundle protein